MNKKRALILLVFIICFGALIRVPRFFSIIPSAGYIGEKIAWYDEAMSIHFASKNLPETIALSGLDSTPLLFFVLLHFWLLISGVSSIILIAILPYIFSVLCLGAIYLLGKEIKSETVGLISAFLLALSPLNIQYATEIRAYSLLVFLAIFYIYFLVRIIKNPERKNYFGLIIFTTALAYTHYSSLALIIPGYIALWYFKKAEIKNILLCGAVSAVCYIPVLVIFGRWGDFFGAGMDSFYGRFFSHGSIAAFFQFLYMTVFGLVGLFSVPVLLSFFIIATLIIYWRKFSEPQSRLVAIMLIGGWLALSAMKLIYHERYFLVYTVPVILIIAVLAEKYFQKYWLAVSASVLLFFSLFILPSYAVSEARAYKYYAPEFSRIINNSAEPGDIIIADHYSQVAIEQYLKNGPEIKLFFPYNDKLTNDTRLRWRYSDYPVVNSENAALVQGLIGDTKRFWVVLNGQEPVEDPSGALSAYLNNNYRLISRYYYPQNPEINVVQTELRLYSSEPKK